MRRSIVVLSLALLLFATPDRAFAHGFGQSYDLPIPLWLFLYGAAAAVLVSFVPISLSAGTGQASHRGYPRFDLLRIGPLRALLTAQPLIAGLRLLSVGLFLLVVLGGLLGNQDTASNFAPTFVWVIWWVGLAFFTAFVGNIWPLVNPWKVLFEWAAALVRRLDPKSNLELGMLPYPASLGVWPAITLYAAFIWIEVAFGGSAVPEYIAFFAISYSFLTWWGMLIFGKDAWLRNGEAFSVLFGVLGRFAPTEVRVKRPDLCKGCGGDCATAEGGCVNCYECFSRAAPEDRELNLRPPAAGLGRAGPVPPGGVFFVILVITAVTYDGLQSTVLWLEVEWISPLSPTVNQSLGLLVLPLLFFAAYLGFVKLSQLLGGGRGRTRPFAAAYVYSLVPIAIAYQVAHYYTFLLIQGQGIIALLSDPFGWGWNLFGTAGYRINVGIVDAAFVWYSQVALIVAGHVIAVYLAHRIALRLHEGRGRTLLSQLPMLALMVLYTVFSLWILSQPQPVVEDQAAPPAEEVSEPDSSETLREPPMPGSP